MNQETKQMFLNASDILRFLISEDENLNSLIIYNPSAGQLLTSDLEVYKALGSIKEYDTFKMIKLVKLFEVVNIVSHKEKTGREKGILKHEEVEEIRKNAINVKMNKFGGN